MFEVSCTNALEPINNQNGTLNLLEWAKLYHPFEMSLKINLKLTWGVMHGDRADIRVGRISILNANGKYASCQMFAYVTSSVESVLVMSEISENEWSLHDALMFRKFLTVRHTSRLILYYSNNWRKRTDGGGNGTGNEPGLFVHVFTLFNDPELRFCWLSSAFRWLHFGEHQVEWARDFTHCLGLKRSPWMTHLLGPESSGTRNVRPNAWQD